MVAAMASPRELADRQAESGEAKAEHETVEEQLAPTKSDLAAAEEKLAAAKRDLAAAEEKLAAAEEKLAAAPDDSTLLQVCQIARRQYAASAALQAAATELCVVATERCAEELSVKRRKVSTGSDKAMSCFFQQLKRATPVENILTIAGLSHQLQGELQLIALDGATDVRFLLRDDYQRLKQTLPLTTSLASIVVGTAGIGKSAFRFYIMREWMLGFLQVYFAVCIFNVGETCYELDKDGNVYQLISGDLRAFGRDALALFDPCKRVTDLHKNFHFKHMVLTTSASPLLNQEKGTGWSLSELAKASDASEHVLQMWTREEILAVNPMASEEMLVAFGCVPRWVAESSVQKADRKLASCFSLEKCSALYEFFKTPFRANVSRSAGLPYRVMHIVEDSKQGWGAKGFISKHVAKLFLDEARSVAQKRAEDFASMLTNPFGHQALGEMFEQWAFAKLVQQGECVLESADPMKGRFNMAGSFERCDVKSKVAAMMKMSIGTLYKAPACFGSIDMYGVTQEVESGGITPGQLMLFQETVGHQHRPALWNHIRPIVTAARESWKDVRVTLTYLVPNGEPFVVPNCNLEAYAVEVVRGSMPEAMEFSLKTWEASLGSKEL